VIGQLHPSKRTNPRAQAISLECQDPTSELKVSLSILFARCDGKWSKKKVGSRSIR